MRQCQRNVVATLKQALLAKRLDLEAIRMLSIRRVHRLRVQVDRQLETRKRLHRMEQPIDVVLGQHDRQQAVLEAIVVENICKRRRDQRTKAVIKQRPWRVLARAAAPEISSRKQD